MVRRRKRKRKESVLGVEAVVPTEDLSPENRVLNDRHKIPENGKGMKKKICVMLKYC